jgi:glycosyltransferase involved in cell wall biosynthesis/voltage-gated potassium channel Kch
MDPLRAGGAVVALTVGVAAYRARAWVDRLLAALREQTLDPDLFEVLFIVNGPDDGTAAYVTERALSEAFDLRVIQFAEGSNSKARNLGMWAARGDYLVWVDSDDSVSPNFLEALLAHAEPGNVVLSAFAEVPEKSLDGVRNFDNYISRGVLKWAGRRGTLRGIRVAGSYDSGKLISTDIARTCSYRADLRTGQDVLYWTQVLIQNDLDIAVPPLGEMPIYVRTVREGSASRTLDQRFAEDRLSCVGALESLRADHPGWRGVLTGMQRAQTTVLGTWLRGYVDKRSEMLARIEEQSPDLGGKAILNHELADTLVASYAFPPSADVSGLVVAKRMLLAGKPYDVIQNSMENARPDDPLSLKLIEPDVGTRIVVHESPSWSRVRGIERYATRGLDALSVRHSKRGSYKNLYSRSMWAASHVLGAAYKIRYPQVHWVAEFSDPLLLDISGDKRIRNLPKSPLVQSITQAARARGFSVPDSNLWEWVEAFTYALADEVTFTNPLQRELMRTCVTDPDLVTRLDEVSRIDPHPVLPSSFYSLVDSNYHLEPGKIHLGYFGIFYVSRGPGDIFQAFQKLSARTQSKFMLHIFTNQPDDTLRVVRAAGVAHCVKVNSYVPYFEFLNLASRLDWLVVADARAKAVHGVNPYIPSKYSDYKGSGSKIWALYEAGSMLSVSQADAHTELGDVDAAVSFLEELAS